MLSSDHAVQRALSLLREAGDTAELLQLAVQPDRSDWVPVVAPEEGQEEGAAAAAIGGGNP